MAAGTEVRFTGRKDSDTGRYEVVSKEDNKYAWFELGELTTSKKQSILYELNSKIKSKTEYIGKNGKVFKSKKLAVESLLHDCVKARLRFKNYFANPLAKYIAENTDELRNILDEIDCIRKEADK